MSKIYQNQSLLDLNVNVSADITGQTSALIKYKKPSGTTGSWTATVTNESTGALQYSISQTSELDEAGEWTCWAFINFPSNKSIAGEPFKLNVNTEGS